MLSLKDKEILEKTHHLEELSSQVSNEGSAVCDAVCVILTDQEYAIQCEDLISAWKLSS